MINMGQARVRPQDRVPTESDKTPSQQTRSYTAPIGGWVTNRNLASQEQPTAVVLDNFWPTPTGILPRGGSKKRVTVPDAVELLFEYTGGASDDFFAATETGVYEFSGTTPDDTALTASITGQTSGAYSTNEVQTDGGSFLTIVNGADYAQIYDGTAWQQVTDVSSPFAITGVDTRILSRVWSYGSRQFFIQENSTDVWYLGVNSVAGAATKLPLAGVFGKGGSLLFGATWSNDSGSGIAGRCVFATDRGEFAVYTGDPSSVETWALNGVFDIGEPLGPDAFMSVGGDLFIATKAGFIPISAALQKDTAQLKLDAITRPIDPDWRNEVLLAGDQLSWRVEKWASRNMVLIVPPLTTSGREFCFVANLETGGWAKFTGWRINSLCVLGDSLHFGTNDGVIYQADVGGTDDGDLIACSACLAFDHLGAPAAIKTAHMLRATFRHTAPYNAILSVSTNYAPSFPAGPNVTVEDEGTEAEWDVSLWDQDFWASDFTDWEISQKWDSVSGHGYTLAVQLQLVSGAPYKLNAELVSVDLTYSVGGIVV